MDKQEIFLNALVGIHNPGDLNKSYNISKKTLEEAGHMFIYSFMCPKFMFDWTKFYFDLFQNNKPDMIIQTLNRILKIGENNNDKTISNLTRMIFDGVSKKFDLEFQLIDKLISNAPLTNYSILRNGMYFLKNFEFF